VFCNWYQGLKARGNVEDWLGKVEENMVTSLRRIAKGAISDYEARPREEWVTLHPSQVLVNLIYRDGLFKG
jgi:dynein heavy chain